MRQCVSHTTGHTENRLATVHQNNNQPFPRPIAKFSPEHVIKKLQNKTKPPETVEECLGYFWARSLTGSATASERCDQGKRRWNARSYWYRPANRWISLWGKEGFPDHESKVWEHQPRSWCHDYSHHPSKGHCLRQKGGSKGQSAINMMLRTMLL